MRGWLHSACVTDDTNSIHHCWWSACCFQMLDRRHSVAPPPHLWLQSGKDERAECRVHRRRTPTNPPEQHARDLPQSGLTSLRTLAVLLKVTVNPHTKIGICPRKNTNKQTNKQTRNLEHQHNEKTPLIN